MWRKLSRLLGRANRSAEQPNVRAATQALLPPPQPTTPAQHAAAALNAFTVSVFVADDEPGSACLSPYSAAIALSVLHLGARGDTRSALDAALGAGDDRERFRTQLRALADALSADGDARQQLAVASALWVAIGYPLVPEFQHRARDVLEATAHALDVSAPAAESARINQWVAGHTAGHITELVPESAIHELTRVVITNAVYFKGRWQQPFDPADTRPGAFACKSGERTDVPMMTQVDDFRLWCGEAVQVLELPYETGGGPSMTMAVVLPRDPRGLAAVEASLTADALASWIASATTQLVEVHLPRWTLRTSRNLNDALTRAGLGALFAPDADFGDVSPEPGLAVDAVIQQTFIEVDERGTEAAAATAVIMVGSAAPPEPVVFRADHPFLFVLRDATSGALLFIGRVTEPPAA